MSGIGSNPAGDIYFHFEFSLPSLSSQLGGAHANEVKHCHLAVVYIVSDPRYYYLIRLMYRHCHIIIFIKLCSRTSDFVGR